MGNVSIKPNIRTRVRAGHVFQIRTLSDVTSRGQSIMDRVFVLLFTVFVGLWVSVCGMSAAWALAAAGGTFTAAYLRPLHHKFLVAISAGLMVVAGLIRAESSRVVILVALLGMSGLLGAALTVRSRRVAVANTVVLVALLGLTEVALRATSSWDGARNFQPVEIYRQMAAGGPDEVAVVGISHEKGLRRTTDQPTVADRRVLIFGGSTTACNEVIDANTWPSALQRLLGGPMSKWLVENHGSSAATAANRVTALKSITYLRSGDLVVFYVGVNDAGVSFTLREAPTSLLKEVPRLGSALRRISEYSVLADRIFRSLVFGGISTSDRARADALSNFQNALSEASTFAEAHGARFVPVLQAHLFTRANPTDYDRGLGAIYSTRLPMAVDAIYPALWNEVRRYDNAIDARSAQDGLMRSPYYDWHHVDARGNEAIARFIFDRVDWYR